MRSRICAVPGCRTPRLSSPVCVEHEAVIPEDLLERLAWAKEYGSKVDWDAAVRAVQEYTGPN